jgi:hypothetical protein
MPAPDQSVIQALASVCPGLPPPLTPDCWRPLFDGSFAERRAALRRHLGYVFWTRELGDALAARLKERGEERRVEVAAGCGRFTAELRARGVAVIATDSRDQSGAAIAARRQALVDGGAPPSLVAAARREEDGILYPDWVERRDAEEAIRTYRPDLVLVSWPPLGSGMVPALLAAPSFSFQALLFIGEPGGCSEAPTERSELPPGWEMECWEECERFLIGFTDHCFAPDDPPANRRGRILLYRREKPGGESETLR